MLHCVWVWATSSSSANAASAVVAAASPFAARVNRAEASVRLAARLSAYGFIAFVIIVAFQPSDFKISRNAVISAPVSVVFAQVNDFHKWENWSRWGKMDPLSEARR